MPSTPYFHSDALRRRFARHVREALAAQRIDAHEHDWLQRLCDAERSAPGTGEQPVACRLVLEDGSPVPIALATALLVVRPDAQGETLYLDTLSPGLERFTSRERLTDHLTRLFASHAGLRPLFELERLQGDPFEQRMLLLATQQAHGLQDLGAEMEKIPSLQQALERFLQPRLTRLWPEAPNDMQAAVVQIVLDDTGQGPPGAEPAVVRVQSIEQAALEALTVQTLPAGQRRRWIGRDATMLLPERDALQAVSLPDMKDDYEALLGAYWDNTDAQGINRRERVARWLADGFAHQAWQLEAAAAVDAATLVSLASRPLDAEAPLPLRRLSVSTAERGPFKLVGLYLIELPAGDLLLYSPRRGVQHLANRAALDDLLDSARGRSELAACLSLDDQNLLDSSASDAWYLQDYALARPLFIDCIDSIVGLQRRNLSEVLKRRSDDANELLAMVDDALDVRALVDPRLPDLGSSHRWQPDAPGFSLTWPAAQQPAGGPGDSQVFSWMEQVAAYDILLIGLERMRPDLQGLARQALAPWLAAIAAAEGLDARDVRVRWGDEPGNDLTAIAAAEPATSTEVALPDLFLARVSGARPAPIPQACLALDKAGQPIEALTPGLLEHLLGQAAPGFEALCQASFAVSLNGPVRSQHLQIAPAQIMGSLRESMLRLELDVARRMEHVASPVADLLQQVLDRPERAQRDGTLEVCSLTLNVNGRLASLALSTAWVLHQPAQPGNGLLFWSSLSGFREFDSQDPLLTFIGRGLVRPDLRMQWLTLFGDSDRDWLDRSLAAPGDGNIGLELQVVEGHFIRRMQLDEQRHQRQALDSAFEQLRHNRADARTCQRYFDLAIADQRLPVRLDVLATHIQNLLFAAVLPDWLKGATAHEMNAYSELLERYYRNADPAQDFLGDIPLLHAFANEQLVTALRHDFPGIELQPQRITVTMTRYIAAPVTVGSIPSGIPAATLVDSESLTAFALNHFSRFQGAVLSVSAPAGQVLPAGLTGDYLAALVHRLDVGQRYRSLLASHFDPRVEGHALRRERFMRQIPERLLVPALEMKLQKLLTPQAFEFIRCVIEMPDARARQPVDELDVVLRPLALVPQPGMAPDRVQGLYLIEARDPGQGPLVLLTLFNDSFGFREFTGRDDLLGQMRSEQVLQALVLDRVESSMRARYANGGLLEAHVPWSTEGLMDVPFGSPGPVSLGTDEVQGNALRYLFEQTLQLLQALSRKQTVTSAEADWASFVNLMSLGAEQVLSLVPGKLGMLVAAWQSEALLRSSAGAAYKQHWGKALSEFSAALGMLVMARREQAEIAFNRPRFRERGFAWRNSALPTDLKRHLQSFEVRDIELDSLQYDQLYNLYHDPHSKRTYAAVAGQVYEVSSQAGVWQIKGRNGSGPNIRLSQGQQWELNLEPGLGGSPQAVSDRLASTIQSRIDEVLNVQATGMNNIRVYSREQARQISLARSQALGYLQKALFNLNAPFGSGLPVEVQGVLKDFFGVQELDTALIDGVRQRVNELFIGLSEDSLARLDSRRFVVGLVKPGYEDVGAFVVTTDPLRRVFLGDLFFAPPVYAVRNGAEGRAFNAAEHFRAIALVHEMSHQVSRTQDIAYLDATAPPLDALDEVSASVDLYKQSLQTLRETSLSHRSKESELFRIREDDGWRDIVPADGALLPAILRVSGQPTLQAARHAFLNDAKVRQRVILENADSVAMLVAYLGLRRFN